MKNKIIQIENKRVESKNNNEAEQDKKIHTNIYVYI